MIINLPTPDGWKAELAWLADTYGTVYPQSGHLGLSTVDWARVSESASTKNQYPTTELYAANSNYMLHSFGTQA